MFAAYQCYNSIVSVLGKPGNPSHSFLRNPLIGIITQAIAWNWIAFKSSLSFALRCYCLELLTPRVKWNGLRLPTSPSPEFHVGLCAVVIAQLTRNCDGALAKTYPWRPCYQEEAEKEEWNAARSLSASVGSSPAGLLEFNTFF